MELGRIIFVTDDFYYGKLKLKSSFRMMYLNQPSSEGARNYFQSQLKKYTISFDKYSLAVLLFLVYTFYNHHYIFIMDMFNTLVANHPNKYKLNVVCFNFIIEMVDVNTSITTDESLAICLQSGLKQFK
jgi:hypothetical protein